jgi:hypothetical protein
VARPGQAREDWRVLAELLPAAVTTPASLKALRESARAQLALNVDLDRLPADGALTGGEA